MNSFWNGFEKRAQMSFEAGPAGAVGGAISGYHSGRSAAGTTANALSRTGFKTKNEESARNIAKATGAIGALAGLGLGYKHKNKLMELAKKHISSHPDMGALYEGAIPFISGTAGGAAAGVATGGLTALRGSLSGKKHEKKAGLGKLIGTVTGVGDIKRGYGIVSKMVDKGKMDSAGNVIGHFAKRKELAGKAMAGGLTRAALLGGAGAYALRGKDGQSSGQA